MAVGKGSMARASKAAVAKAEAPAVNKEKVEPVKKVAAPAKKVEKKVAAPKKPVAKKSAVKETVIAATSEQVMKQISYQQSSQVLTRDAKPNESFFVGDAMPIYFL